MRATIISIFFFMTALLSFGQKDVTQTLDATGIQKLIINTDEVFKIHLQTQKTSSIKIITHSEGEYYNQIFLDTEISLNTIRITSQFEKILQSGFDKLSAHKVFSFEITLIIPENLEVLIESNIASVEATGYYDNLSVQLREGYCKLEDFKGNATVNTYSGFIEVHTQNAAVTATSRNGKVVNIPVYAGEHTIQLKSVNGDIRVSEN